MEIAECGTRFEAQVSVRTERQFYGTADSGSPQRHETRVNPFKDFDLLVLAGAPLKHDRNCQSDEEQNTEENQHEVQVQWRINLRDVGKKKRAGQEEDGLLDEPLAEHELRCGRRETAGGTLIRDARSATV